MGVFEKAMQERHPEAENPSMTIPQAFAAIIIGALNADGRNAQEEAARVNGIFASTQLFRRASDEPLQAVLNRVVALFGAQGGAPIVALAAKTLPQELRGPAFATAVDVVLSDGEASLEERRFIDTLQQQLQITDEDALKIVDVMIVKNSA